MQVLKYIIIIDSTEKDFTSYSLNISYLTLWGAVLVFFVLLILLHENEALLFTKPWPYMPLFAKPCLHIKDTTCP